MSEGILKPISGDLLSEPAIVCRMAIATLGKRSKINWNLYESNYDYIRNDIEKVIPGFDIIMNAFASKVDFIYLTEHVKESFTRQPIKPFLVLQK